MAEHLTHFDACVIGMERPGLIAAALLAKRGRRVLLVDHGENVFTYRRNGLRLPLVPRLLPSLETAPHVRRVVDELGLGPTLRTALVPLEPAFQAVMPRHRIDIHGDRARLVEELGREFPELERPIAHFFEKLFALDEQLTNFLAKQPPLPPTGWRERLRARSLLTHAAHLDAPFENHELLAQIPHDHPVRDLLLAPLTFFGYLASDAPSTFHAVRLIARYYAGAVRPKDRYGELGNILLRACEGAGVEVHRGAVVQRIDVSGRRLTGMEVEDDRLRYSADFFVANTATAITNLLPAGKAQTKYALELAGVRSIGSLLVLNLVVGKDVVPKGMGEALFLLNGRRRSRDEEPIDPPLFLRRYPALRGEISTKESSQVMVDSEHEVLSIACPVRSDLAHQPERMAAVKSAMLSRVQRVVPFLDEYLSDASLPSDTAGWDIEAAFGHRRVDPWSLHPFYEVPKRPLLGIAGRSVRTWFKNLLHCGTDVVPGLGLEGEYVTGLSAADTMMKMAGKRWRAS